MADFPADLLEFLNGVVKSPNMVNTQPLYKPSAYIQCFYISQLLREMSTNICFVYLF